MERVKYPLGSEWRRWDLHLHTPKSIVQQYGGDTINVWDAFIQKIASLPSEIKVIGITDYLFCDGYEYLLTRKDEIPNIDLIILNIEFRLNTFSGTASNTKRHNFHVLFDPSVSIIDIREQFLGGLSTGYRIQDGSEWQQTPTLRSLEQLGNQIKAAAPEGNSIHNKTNLEVGFDNITYKLEDIEKLLKKNCFKGKFITAIGYSEWDQAKWDQSAAEKRTLINSAGFSLTCSDNPAAINENHKNLKDNNLNSLVLHSSDAHSFERIGKTLLWIKADPTFAGLKQVINEPDSRVFIGETPPNFKPDYRIIKKILIPTSNGWFADNFELELNRDLITIIGGRGSGKSALAESIAYGAGSKDPSTDSFLSKTSKHKNPIKGSTIFLEWSDGSKTEFEIGKLSKDYELVQFLPQGAVEDLCSPHNSEKMQKQIENVIFQKLSDAEKMGCSNFDELKTMVLNDFKYEKEDVVKKIHEINHEIGNLTLILQSLPVKEKLLKEKNLELDVLKKSLPELPAEDIKGQEDLAQLIEQKKKYEIKIIEFRGVYHKIVEIETKVKIFKNRIKEFHEDISHLLVDFDDLNLDIFNVFLDEEKIKKNLDEKKEYVTSQVKNLDTGNKHEVSLILGIPEGDLLFDNLQDLNNGIENKQKETKSFETTKLKYQQQKGTISTIESFVKAIEIEIARIQSESIPKKADLELERMNVYTSYFQILKNEKIRMEELYKPLQASLSAGTDTDKKLVFEAQICYSIEDHCKSGLEIIDRSRKGNFREIDSIKKTFTDFWQECFSFDFDDSVIREKLNYIINKFTTFEGGEILIENQLRETHNFEEFLNWIFDPTYYGIISSLKFDDTDLYLLSPGQKGIILLILYLKIDEADFRPLIIDQPEENLDNLSVYKDLIEYFRDRKKYRQIIMVTHNPNLVVNTDAEQIIIASYDGKEIPRLKYSSGSLEDQAINISEVEVEEFKNGIIEQVCDILEGGEPVFVSRKKKYQISAKSDI